MATTIWGYCILVAVMVMASLLATYEKPWGQVSANRTTDLHKYDVSLDGVYTSYVH